MEGKKKFRILITLIITILIFTLPAGALAASVDDGWRLISEGGRLYHKSDFYGAAKKWEEALRIFEQNNFKKGISAAIGNLGIVYANLGQYQKALRFYEKALAIDREFGDRKGEGNNLTNIGVVYWNLGQYQKALRFYEKALAIQREIGDRKGEGGALTNIGIVYWNLGQYQKALSHYEKALAIKREIGDRKGEGNNLTNIGIVYWNLGQYQKALSHYEKALAIKREIGDRKGEGGALGNIGIVYKNLGQYQKALAYYEKALAIHKEIGDRNGEGNSLGNIGIVYKNLGQYQKALSYYEKALAIHKEIGDRNGEGNSLGNIGLVYWNLGQYQKALAYYEKALAIHKEIGVPTGTVECNIGDIYLETGNTDRAKEIYEKLRDPIRLGRLCLVRKDFPKSLKHFQKALKQSLKGRNASFLFADYVGLGLSSEGVKGYGKAKDFYLKALELTEEMRDSLTPGQRSHFFATKTMGFSCLEPYEGLIRVLNRLKEKGSSLYYAEYTKARLFTESIASAHEGLAFGLPPGLAADEQDIVNQIAALYRQREKAYSQNRMEAYENIDKRIKAKKEKQRRLISEIRENHPEYASMKYPQPVKAIEIPLKANEYLVEYEVTDTATFAWLVHEGRIVKSVTIPISRKELAGLVRKYRAYFQVSRKSDLTGFDPRTGHKLYALLMEDILNVVPKEANIIIVPDEILGVLPFEALVSEMPKRYQMAEGKKGPFPLGIRYVGDERNISYCQSATSLAVMRSLRKETRAKKPMLVVADPVFNVADVRVQGKTYLAKVTEYQMNLMRAVEDEGGFSFPRLEETSVLAKRLDKIFDRKVDVLEGLNASYARLKKHNLKDYKYLVFATHGILDNHVPGIREPALVLTQLGNPEDEDGFLTMSEVMDLSLDATCSALTACETGLGRNISGEGVMGMGRAFQYAGSRSVLVSLWSVAEESTTKLAERFFYYLKIGKKNQEALKLARTDIRRDGYEHPFYWAPFILIGE
ncbi:MAG: tetratricopeptide repeat protein [Desulfobacterales bacterium]|nr:tetratricopeptide repeat protein [Desulfobacterales bacterium]